MVSGEKPAVGGGAVAPEGVKTLAGAPEFVAPAADEQIVTLKNEVGEFRFSNIGGGLASVRLLQHAVNGADLVEINQIGRAPIGSLSRVAGEPSDGLVYAVNAAESGVDRVVFEAVSAENLKIKKTYTLRHLDESVDLKDSGHPAEMAPGYVVDYELTMESVGDAVVTATDYYVYIGASGPLAPSQWDVPNVCWMMGEEADHEAVSGFTATSFLGMSFGENREEIRQALVGMGWVGVYNQFYATLVMPSEPLAGSELWSRRVLANNLPTADKPYYGIESAFQLPVAKAAPGEPVSYSMEIYAGPRSYEGLKSLGGEREDVMFYGWFSPISGALMWLLLKIKGWVGVFGIAVILVTVILRILIWPLHAKSTRTMKRMSQLTPKMNEVREKYKDNPQKQQQEMMTLYKTYGVNPFGGCLPMFLQIPIFFGFYRMLQSAVELRGQSFLWVEDLSMPDTIAQVGGIDVNPLPLLMAVTMVLQMAVTPTSGDKTQQRMFMIMPVVFLFICYNFASALALYWTTQNIFAIGQTWLMGKMPQPTLERKKPAPKGPRGGAGGDGSGKPKKPKGPRTGGSGKSALKKNG